MIAPTESWLGKEGVLGQNRGIVENVKKTESSGGGGNTRHFPAGPTSRRLESIKLLPLQFLSEPRTARSDKIQKRRTEFQTTRLKRASNRGDGLAMA